MLLALSAQQLQALAPIVNLSEVNPYVASAVGDWRSRHTLAAALPRQQAPLSSVGPAQAAAGSSSFGMSGVNAHVLLMPVEAGAAPPAAAATPALLWQRQRYWPTAAPHPLLLHCSIAAATSSGSAVGSTARYSCSFVGTSSAFLRDHCIGGRLLVPASAFFELLAAAAATARDDSLQQRLAPSLAAVAIQAPKILSQQPTAAADAAQPDAVQVVLHLASGAAEVASADGTVHVRSGVAAMPVAPVELSSTAGQPTVMHALVSLQLVRSSGQPSCFYNFAQLSSGSSSSGGSGWLAHPAPADASLHLSAVKVAGLTDDKSRVPVAVASVAASAPTGTADCQKWAASELPIVAADNSAICCIRSQLAGGARFTAAGLHAKPLPGNNKAVAAAVDAAADVKAFEQSNFTYEIEWQAAAAAPVPVASGSQVVLASGSGLRLLADDAAAAAAADGGLPAGLAVACQLSIMPAGGSRISSTAVAAGGIELLQRVLSAGGAAAVQALTAAASSSPAEGQAGVSSAILAALLKVAAVENPSRRWATLSADRQEVQPTQASLSLQDTGADQHGAQTAAGTLRQPELMRHAM